MPHKQRALAFKNRVAEIMITVGMRINHPLNRLVGGFAYRGEQLLGTLRMLTRVDQQYALVRHQPGIIGFLMVVLKEQTGRDLGHGNRNIFLHDRAIRRRLCKSRRK